MKIKKQLLPVQIKSANTYYNEYTAKLLALRMRKKLTEVNQLFQCARNTYDEKRLELICAALRKHNRYNIFPFLRPKEKEFRVLSGAVYKQWLIYHKSYRVCLHYYIKMYKDTEKLPPNKFAIFCAEVPAAMLMFSKGEAEENLKETQKILKTKKVPVFFTNSLFFYAFDEFKGKMEIFEYDRDEL